MPILRDRDCVSRWQSLAGDAIHKNSCSDGFCQRTDANLQRTGNGAEKVVFLHSLKYATSLNLGNAQRDVHAEQGIVGSAYFASLKAMTSSPSNNILSSKATWIQFRDQHFGAILRDENKAFFIKAWLDELERIAGAIEGMNE